MELAACEKIVGWHVTDCGAFCEPRGEQPGLGSRRAPQPGRAGLQGQGVQEPEEVLVGSRVDRQQGPSNSCCAGHKALEAAKAAVPQGARSENSVSCPLASLQV